MPSLAETQRNLIATVNEGPGALDARLFAGMPDRIILGLKAHANTISHARLVALEASFPLTRAEIGEARFNAICRDYTDTAYARGSDIALIGRDFANFLESAAASPAICDLAAVEWAWLESYHAADAGPLLLADIAALDDGGLLALQVILHPAARLVKVRSALANPLAHLAQGRDAAILISRPEAEVRLLAIDERTYNAAHDCLHPTTIGNLLALASEQAEEADAIGPAMTLIGAGALVVME